MTLDAAQRRVVLEDLAHRLEAKFLHPQTGARYAAMRRRRITDGAYDKLGDPPARRKSRH